MRANLKRAPKKAVAAVVAAAFCAILAAFGISFDEANGPARSVQSHGADTSVAQYDVREGFGQPDAQSLANVPAYSGKDYIELNGGVPVFTEEELDAPEGTEVYGQLDSLGRATYAFANLCEDTRPPKGSTRDTKMPNPTGFVQAFYPEIGLDHLYERSHLIAYSLNDEAVNPRDLITGTEHLNQETMQPFEEAIRNCISAMNVATHSENHVVMRVTPDFRGNDLVARGVQIEALSLEDDGDSVCLNVYCYNVQPDVYIDYATGQSHLE